MATAEKKTRKPSKAQILTVARKVRETIKSSKNWIQGDDAADADGDTSVDARSKEAVKFCLNGAAQHATKSEAVVDAFLAEVGRTLDPELADDTNALDAAVQFNDTSTHKKVVGVVDRTIKRLSK